MKTTLPSHGGYLRMPNEWLRLPVSPAAKVLLAHFCSAASEFGASWYSYEQLSEIVGRSKASISTYVKELRAAGVISVRNQRTANGFNYRLFVTIVGWRDLLADWTQGRKPSKSGSKKTERRVQPTERNDPTGHKTKTYKTKTPPCPIVAKAVAAISSSDAQGVVWEDKDERDWARFRPSDRDPATSHGALPAPELIEKIQARVLTLCATTGVLDQAEKRELVTSMMLDFCEKHRISPSEDEQEKFRAAVMIGVQTKNQAQLLFDKLSDRWHPSWKRLSTPSQIQKICDESDARSLSPKGKEAAELTMHRGRLMMFELIAKMQRNRGRLG